MAAMNITDKRLETINFSDVYAAAPASFAVLKSSPLAKMPGIHPDRWPHQPSDSPEIRWTIPPANYAGLPV